ncbi:MAG: MerR family transcriptional regulator [Oscillospiraceae bacterium]|nr:MerR family transcriptional regulator [Oscillospiraceae bacterium]
MEYSISEASKILGIPASTLRYYDNKGFIPKIGRSETGHRVFSEGDLDLLRAVQRGIQVGMSLSEMRELYDTVITGDNLYEGRDRLLKKRAELEMQIARLQSAISYIDSLIPEYNRRIENGLSARDL